MQETTTTEPVTDGSTGSERTQRASGRPGKGTYTSKKFADEDFNKKPGQVRMAKLARNLDSNDEDEPASLQEAINHPTRGKQWEKAIQDEVNSLIKNHTWDLVHRP